MQAMEQEKLRMLIGVKEQQGRIRLIECEKLTISTLTTEAFYSADNREIRGKIITVIPQTPQRLKSS